MATDLQYLLDFLPSIKSSLTLFAVLIVFYIVRHDPFKHILHLVERRDNALSQAHKEFDSEHLSQTHRATQQEYIESETFKRNYGIEASPKFRSAIFDFYIKNQTDITWKQIRSAKSHLRTRDKSIHVYITTRDIINRWYISITASLMLAYSLLILGSVITQPEQYEAKQATILAALSIAILSMSIVFFRQNNSYHNAKYLKKLTHKHTTKDDQNSHERIA